MRDPYVYVVFLGPYISVAAGVLLDGSQGGDFVNEKV